MSSDAPAANRPIAVIGGTGPAGMGLALRWARAGETIIIGSRDEQRAQQAAAGNSAESRRPGQRFRHGKRAACAAADILMLTVPFEGQAALLKQLKPAITEGSILIDATVPLAASVGGRASRTLGVWQGSAAQQAAELVPKEVSVVAAFHNVSADLLYTATLRSIATSSSAATMPTPRNSPVNWRPKFRASAPSMAANSKTPASSSRSPHCSSA